MTKSFVLKLNPLLHEFFFSSVLRFSLRYAAIVTDLIIDAALIGVFIFIITSYFNIEILAIGSL